MKDLSQPVFANLKILNENNEYLLLNGFYVPDSKSVKPNVLSKYDNHSPIDNKIFKTKTAKYHELNFIKIFRRVIFLYFSLLKSGFFNFIKDGNFPMISY